MILKAQEIDRAKSSQGARLQKQREEHTDNLSKLILGQKEMQRLYAPVIDTKGYKQQFLRGQPYNITAYVELKQPTRTSYQASMHGLQPDDRAKVVDYERSSCGIGGVIPDPMTMTRASLRIAGFSDDLRRAEKTEFNYTGDDWMVSNN